MEAIKEQQIPCAYFYPMEPFASGNIDAVREWGMNVTTICTWDKNVGEINYPACRVVGLKEFLSDPREVKVIYDGGTAKLFSSLGAKVYAFEMDKKNYEVCKSKAERPYDLWDLREYISALCPSYRFEFRHYPIDVTDYWLSEQDKALLNEYGLGYKIPTSCETVLYCY